MATGTANQRATQTVREGYEYSRVVVREHPLSSALTVFGLGFGLGVTLGMLLTESESSHRSSYSNQLERFGRQVLDAIAHSAPDVITKRFS